MPVSVHRVSTQAPSTVSERANKQKLCAILNKIQEKSSHKNKTKKNQINNTRKLQASAVLIDRLKIFENYTQSGESERETE